MVCRAITAALTLTLVGCQAAGPPRVASPVGMTHAANGLEGAQPTLSSPPVPAPPATPEAAEGTWLFRPDFVLSHAREAGLSDAQVEAVREDSEQFEHRATELREEAARHGLDRPLGDSPEDEMEASDRLERSTGPIAQLREQRIALLARIRDRLAPEQQDKLEEIRTRVY